MDLHDLVLHLRELMLVRGVALSPGHTDAEETYEGRGADALHAWEAFRVVAGKPAFDPVDLWDEETTEVIQHAGFLFDGTFSAGWPARHGHTAMPEHYELMFTRQFATGDAGDMVGLNFTIFFPASDELRELKAEIWGSDDDDADALPALARTWIDDVENSPAFSVPMTRHDALSFSFGIDAIG